VHIFKYEGRIAAKTSVPGEIAMPLDEGSGWSSGL